MFCFDKLSESSPSMCFTFYTPQFINPLSGKLLVSSCSLLAKRLDCYKVRGFKNLTKPPWVYVPHSLLEGSIMNWIYPPKEDAIGNICHSNYSRWPSTVLTRWSSSTTPWDTPASRAMPTTCASDLTSSLQCFAAFKAINFLVTMPLIFWGVKIYGQLQGFTLAWL